MEEKFKLDLKSKKILFYLDFDARQSNSELARKVGLSKQGVDYRIKQMIKNGIILGFYPIINLPRLGYLYGRIWLKFHNLTREKEAEILEKFIKNPRINWSHKTEGNYDVLISFWAKNLDEIKRVSHELLLEYGNFIKEKKGSVGIRLVHFQNRYLLETKEGKEISAEESKETMKIDELDKKILKELCHDARIPLVKLAKKLGVSSKVVSYRIKNLEKKKIILGYRPHINFDIMGWKLYKVIFHFTNVTEEKYKRFRALIKNNPRVVYIVDDIGIDFDVEIMVRSISELYDFIKEIKYRFPDLIREYETLALVRFLKINYLPIDL